MPIDIKLEDERGNVQRCLADRKNRIPKLANAAGVPMLSDVDPYGDTVFNRLQCTRIILELSLLKSKTTDEVDHGLLSALTDMAYQCEQGVHLYLRFVGD